MRKYGFAISVIVLLAVRFLHFGAEIDEPHDWRQCDTAFYIYDFYKHGIDLLYPEVCWMGSHGTLLLECPLPEALVAMAYRVFGESIPLARLLFLAFFGGAVFYFHRVIRLLFEQSIARIATLVYLAMPLSLFYSRAIHIDFFVIFLIHSMLYYFVKAGITKEVKWLILSGCIAIPAALVKLPYLFCVALPMIAYLIKQQSPGWLLKQMWVYLPAILLFLLWQQHTYAVNAAAPDWDFLLHYRKFDQNSHWYFGSWAQRLSLYHWWILAQRAVLEVAGPGGIVFFVFGLFKLQKYNNAYFIVAWMAGLAIYILLFFNLNFVHNYYQIPLLAPVAVIIAFGILSIARHRPVLQYGLVLLLAAIHIFYAETHYYHQPVEQIEAARLIRQHTPDDALVIITYGNFDCRNPKLLYRARRRGWSVELLAVNNGVIEALRKEGATHWAFLSDGQSENVKEIFKNLPGAAQEFLVAGTSLTLYLQQL